VKIHVQAVVDLPQQDGKGLYLCLKDINTEIFIGYGGFDAGHSYAVMQSLLRISG
jgi:hypothetical protein